MNRLEIETSRLRLHPIALSNLDDMQRIWNEAGVRRFLWDDQPVSREMAEGAVRHAIGSFEQRGFGMWTITHKQDAAVIGSCGLRSLDGGEDIEILYGITIRYWNVGLTTEAVKAVLQYGFEHAHLERVIGVANPRNVASWRVMEKAGMKYLRSGRLGNEDVVYYATQTSDAD